MSEEWVVVVTERNVWPPEHGCDARIVRMLKGWRASGFRVCLVGSSLAGVAAAGDLVDDLVLVGDGPLWDYCMDLDHFDFWSYLVPVADACARHSAVAAVAEYVWMAPALRCVPQGVVRVVDTHDLMHRRREIYEDHDIEPWIRVSREEEAAILSGADVVVAIQEDEAVEFRDMMPGTCVVVAGHWVDEPPAIRVAVRDEVMFVGSDNPSNEHCLRKFVEETWPLVLDEVPDAVLKVYGKVAGIDDFSAFKGVEPVGFVDDLASAYAQAKVVVNPVALGTGLKIKTVEALAAGKAVVCTSEGCSGMTRSDASFLVEDDGPAFAKQVVAVLRDDCRRVAMEEGAASYARRHFSVTAVMGPLAAEVRSRAPKGREGWAEPRRKARTPVFLHAMGDMMLARAVECWRRAAWKGSVQSARNLAWAYKEGIGVDRDGKMAAMWVGVARGDVFRSDPQIGQDRWVVDLLGGMRGGYFVDAGASDGLGGSNTYALEKLFGWDGVCIEASAEFYPVLSRSRTCACACVCLSDRVGFERFAEAGYHGGIEGHLKEHHREHWGGATTREAPADTLDSVLRGAGAPRRIDYMSVDLEGGEVAVLNAFPWDEWDVRCMTVERSCPEVEGVVRDAGFEIVRSDFCSEDVDWELHCVGRSRDG